MRNPRIRGVNPLGVIRFARKHPGAAVRYGSAALLHANTLALLVHVARMDDRDPDHAIAIDVLDRSLLLVAPRSMMLSRTRLSDLSATELADIKAEFLASIDRFVDGGLTFWAAVLPRQIVIDRLEVWRDATGTNAHRELHGPWPLHFWSSVAGLIETSGHLFRRCARCSIIFVRSGRSEYCSRACSQRARSAANYQRHRKRILDQRRHRYERAITKHQPHAKIQRRPRKRGTTQ